jgi:hypothetical protein
MHATGNNTRKCVRPLESSRQFCRRLLGCRYCRHNVCRRRAGIQPQICASAYRIRSSVLMCCGKAAWSVFAMPTLKSTPRACSSDRTRANVSRMMGALEFPARSALAVWNPSLRCIARSRIIKSQNMKSQSRQKFGPFVPGKTEQDFV